MKRLSHKIRKRFSISSKDRTRQRAHSEGHIYKGETVQECTEPTKSERRVLDQAAGTVTSAVINGNTYSSRLSQTPGLDSEHHDYSTLDGEDDPVDIESKAEDRDAQDYNDATLNLNTSQCGSPESSNHTSASSQELVSTSASTSKKNGPGKRAKNSVSSNNSNNSQSLVYEFQLLARKGWYWGPMTREQAEKKLCSLPEASFLVRDSSDDRYLLSLSFRSNHRTLHTRIEHSGMKFSFYEDSPSQAYTSVVELIEKSIRDSNEQGVFCYSRSRQRHAQTYPVRLVHPVSRFTEVRPLQDLCRFVIRQSTRIDHIQNLPLPNQIKGYLNQSYF